MPSERVSEHCAVSDHEGRSVRPGSPNWPARDSATSSEAVEILAEKDENRLPTDLEAQMLDYHPRPIRDGGQLRSIGHPTDAQRSGAWAVHVPYPLDGWAHEHIDDATLKANERYRRIDSLAELPAVLAELSSL